MCQISICPDQWSSLDQEICRTKDWRSTIVENSGRALRKLNYNVKLCCDHVKLLNHCDIEHEFYVIVWHCHSVWQTVPLWITVWNIGICRMRPDCKMYSDLNDTDFVVRLCDIIRYWSLWINLNTKKVKWIQRLTWMSISVSRVRYPQWSPRLPIKIR